MTDAEIDALISERKCRKCGEEYENEHVCRDVKDKAQTFALNTWLFDYPSDMTYEQIVEALDKDKWSAPHDGWKDKNILTKEVIDDGVVGAASWGAGVGSHVQLGSTGGVSLQVQRELCRVVRGVAVGPGVQAERLVVHGIAVGAAQG
jgi:hypothetical protein